MRFFGPATILAVTLLAASALGTRARAQTPKTYSCFSTKVQYIGKPENGTSEATVMPAGWIPLSGVANANFVGVVLCKEQ